MGDVPTWVGAVGTVFGVVAAAVAAYFVYGQLAELRGQSELQRRASEDQQRELADIRAVQEKQLELMNLEIFERRSSQARQIKVRRVVREWGGDQDISNGYTLAVEVRNDSSAPVSNVMVKYPNQPNFDDGERSEYTYTMQTNWFDHLGGEPPKSVEDLRRIRGAAPLKMLEQGRVSVFTAAPRQKSAARLLTGIVRFTDADQRHWHVDELGVLTEIGERAW
jgi:hypothetical protein